MKTRVSEIVAAWQQGQTLIDIGARHNISGERVRQILKDAGHNGETGGTFARKRADAAKREAARLAEWLPQYGCTLGQFREVPAPVRRLYRDRQAYAIKVGRSLKYTLVEFHQARIENRKVTR